MSPDRRGALRASRLPVRVRKGVTLVIAGLLAFGIARVAFAAGTFSRVSISNTQAQADSDSGNDRQAVSADGRYVVFSSDADNLVSGDTNFVSDVFLRDTLANTTERVSVASGGTEANGASSNPSISPDGRFIAFQSNATNLIGAGNDTNGVSDVFIRDRQTATTERVSVASNGAQANNDSQQPAVSADGRFVSFFSSATNLVTGDTNAVVDVFVRDRVNQVTTRVSVATGGAQGNGFSMDSAISGDGRFVVFDSNATNLVAGDTNGSVDVFLRDTIANTTARVSVGPSSAQGNGISYLPSISADGRYVVFQSIATNLVPNDTNGQQDIFLRDRGAAATYLISLNVNGHPGDGASSNARISDDGLTIAFDSLADDLVAQDTNAVSDVFIRERSMSVTYRASASSAWAQAGGGSMYPALSNDGRYVAFASDAADLVASDTNGTTDVFLRDLDSGLSPVAPSNLNAVALNATQIKLTWIDNANNEAGVEIQRDSGSGFTQLAVTAANAISYTDSALTPNTLYIYRVRALNAIGVSDFSNAAATETMAALPAAPSSLAATVGSSTSVNLHWLDNANNEDDYRLEMQIGAGAFAEIAVLAPNTTSRGVTGLTANTAYTFRVRAHNSGGFSTYSTSAQVTTYPLPPTAPSGMTAKATDSTHVALAWVDGSNNETGFKIERKLGATSFVQIAAVGANVTAYADATASPNNAYTYRVRAANTGGYSGYATAAAVTPLGAPTGLALQVVNSTTLKLTWVDHATGETGFHIERKIGAGAYVEIASVAANVLTYSNTGLTAGTTYTYRVRAYGTNSLSSYSNAVAGTP